jgi:hypothetical protein
MGRRGSTVVGIVLLAVVAAGLLAAGCRAVPGFGGQDCEQLAAEVAMAGHPWEEEVTSINDRGSEIVGGHERHWTVHHATYRNEDAAAEAFEAIERAQSPRLKECFSDIEFPVEVEDGYGVGEVRDEPGLDRQAYFAAWLDGDRVVGFSAYTTSNDDISTWVREQYEEARAEPE